MRLTRNFMLSEFDSKDGAIMPRDVQDRVQKLAIQLQVLRDYLNTSITVNSGYRSPEHNRNVGGVDNSTHLTGDASDIKAKGYSSNQVYNAIEYLIDQGLMLQGGLGLYDGFVHYDIAYNGRKRRWEG